MPLSYDRLRPSGRAGTVPVWDRGVRAFHWLLVAAVATAAFTGFVAGVDWLAVHLIAGSTIAVLLVCRIVWGFAGPGYARFATFAFGPRQVLAHARAIADGRGRRHLGHNPLGSAMVFTLIGVLALMLATGTVVLGGDDKQGPLAAFVSFATGDAVRQIHQMFAIVLLVLVGLHLAGVAFESWRERENLAAAMVSGRKRAEPGAAAPAGRARPGPAGLACAVVLLPAVAAIVTLASLPGRGVPPATLAPEYIADCGACHFTYPPSLLPAASWQAMMGHLATHFGEDAHLPAPAQVRLTAYLVANSAEHWDTRAAVMFGRTIDPATPERITATSYWKRMHHDIADAVFDRESVAGRGGCKACHADAATGRFAPQEIDIPDK